MSQCKIKRETQSNEKNKKQQTTRSTDKKHPQKIKTKNNERNKNE